MGFIRVLPLVAQPNSYDPPVLPLRTVGITAEGEEITSVVTGFEVAPQPPELFTVPEGYEKEGL